MLRNNNLFSINFLWQNNSRIFLCSYWVYYNVGLDELLKVRGCQNLEPGELHISGTDPVMDSPFKLGEVAAAAHAVLESQSMTFGS